MTPTPAQLYQVGGAKSLSEGPALPQAVEQPLGHPIKYQTDNTEPAGNIPPMSPEHPRAPLIGDYSF